MTKTTIPQFDLFGGAPEVVTVAHEQFRLTRFQVFNWGTFSDLVDIAITEKGFLFVGPSGAGKSTLLDANSTLMTPPKWLGFNVAAREGESAGNQDRNLMTYVRGAWAQQTGKHGEAVQQYLRENTTWSALAQTYTSTSGRAITIAQAFWVRGKTTDKKEIKRTYMVIDRALDLRELDAFASKDFDLKVLRGGQGISVHDEFSGYRERFCRLLGIEQESALRLLHKTQSAKNLGDLNDFLRDFMLDPPETFELANKLVGHFQSLREAHASVVDTRRQIEALTPAKESFNALSAERVLQRQLTETKENLDAFKEQCKGALLDKRIASSTKVIAEKTSEALILRQAEAEIHTHHAILFAKRNGGEGAQIARCETELSSADAAANLVRVNQPLLDAVSALVAKAYPFDTPGFYILASAADRYVDQERQREAQNRDRRDELKTEHSQLSRELTQVHTEIVSLSKRRSNIPARLQAVRTRICAELGMAEADLPFAGELIDVRDDQKAWKPAAERVLRNFAENMLVADGDYARVSKFISTNHMGTSVKYFRVKPVKATTWTVEKNSLFSKLAFADTVLAQWLSEKAKSQFDHECVDTQEEFERSRRAVTKEGLVKSDEVSHRKDDRRNINDQSEWILGGDTTEKLANRQDRADELDDDIKDLVLKMRALEPTDADKTNVRQCLKLSEMEWSAFDLATVERRVSVAQTQLDAAKAAMPDLEALDAQITDVTREHTKAQQGASVLEAQRDTLASGLAIDQNRRFHLTQKLLDKVLSDEINASLRALYEVHTTELALDNLDFVTSEVKDVLARDERAIQVRATGYLNAMNNQFRDYMRGWPAKAASLEASEAGAQDFFAILTTLELDGLPQYEARFLKMLQEQGTQEMMRLSVQLETERKAIKHRLEDVNESLQTAAFNAGTHLVIESKEKMLPDVMAFRQNLKEAYSNYLLENTKEDAERRFNILNDIVVKLESQDASSKAWREVCLDVRRHVDFIIRELDAVGNEVEVYRSGAGKSGGQRQKLTATCLAAALRYQLGGKETGMPKFSTVFMDEAFDKADAEFTDLAMNIFKTFGFQLVVATPLKSVMTLEPYIGGACFVHIEDRKHSRIVPVTYLDATRKLDFKAAGLSDALIAE